MLAFLVLNSKCLPGKTEAWKGCIRVSLCRSCAPLSKSHPVAALKTTTARNVGRTSPSHSSFLQLYTKSAQLHFARQDQWLGHLLSMHLGQALNRVCHYPFATSPEIQNIIPCTSLPLHLCVGNADLGAETRLVAAQHLCYWTAATGWKRIAMHPSTYTRRPRATSNTSPSAMKWLLLGDENARLLIDSLHRGLWPQFSWHFQVCNQCHSAETKHPNKQCHMLASCSIVLKSKQIIACRHFWLFCTHCLTQQWRYQQL